MPIFVTLFLYIYIIKQGSNLYIYGWLDLGTWYGWLDIGTWYGWLGLGTWYVWFTCVLTYEFPILKGRIYDSSTFLTLWLSSTF